MNNLPAAEKRSLKHQQLQATVYDPRRQGPASYYADPVVSNRALPTPIDHLKREPSDHPLQDIPELANSYFNQTEEIETNPVKLEVCDHHQHEQASLRRIFDDSPKSNNLPLLSRPIVQHLGLPTSILPDEYSNLMVEGPTWFSAPSAEINRTSPKPSRSTKVQMCNREDTPDFSVDLHPAANTQPVPVAILQVSHDDTVSKRVLIQTADNHEFMDLTVNEASTTSFSQIQDETNAQLNELSQDNAEYSAVTSNLSVNKDVKTYKYGTCREQFESLDLKPHVLCYATEQHIVCDFCQTRFKEEHHLAEHICKNTCSRQSEFKPRGELFRTADRLKVNLRMHPGEGPFKCDLCPKVFKHKSSLGPHLVKHNELFACSLCERSFRLKSTLTKHIAAKHKDFKPFSCNLCHKRFNRKFVLRLHMYLHSASSRFECKTCGKLFETEPKLNRHLFIYTGEFPYKCDLCQEGFMLERYLTHHMLIHRPSSFRPFLCNLCQKSFTQKAVLTSHSLIHSDWPSECKTCGKLFQTSVNLNSHLLVHAGEFPIKCERCHEDFVDMSDLAMHDETCRFRASCV